MISLCLGTRQRPELFKKMCESALSMATNPDNIEFVTYHDQDDPTTPQYEFKGHYKQIIGPRLFSPQLYANVCQKIAEGPIYMFLTDDLTFETKDWDVKVEQAFKKDKLVLVCPDSKDWEIWNFGTMGFLHKEWMERLGYFMAVYSPDRWLNEIATAAKRSVRLMDVRLNHTNIHDDVHSVKNHNSLKYGWSQFYYSPENEKLRQEDIKKLCMI